MRVLSGAVAWGAAIIGLALLIFGIVDVTLGNDGFSMWVALAVGVVLVFLGLAGLGDKTNVDGWREDFTGNAERDER